MQQPRLEIAEHILDVMEDVMCRQITKNCTPLSELKEWMITEDMSDEERSEREVLDTFDAENLLAEHGCTICRAGSGDFRMTDCETGHTAAGCNIDFLECNRVGGKRFGTFHTHPMGLPLPSHPDIKCSFEWKTSYDFVGGLVGDQKMIVCYMPRPESEMKYGHLEGMCVFRNRVPIPNYPTGAEHAIGKILFYREDPGPMSSELLESFDSVFPSDYYDEETRKEYREELEGGEIPYAFWETYEAEGEMDELAVYSAEDQREGFEEQLAELSAVFSVLVRYC